MNLKKIAKKILPYWVRRPFRLAYEFCLRTSWKFRLPPKYDEKVAAEVEDYLNKYHGFDVQEPLIEPVPASWDYVETGTQTIIRNEIGLSQWEYVIHRANEIPSPALLSLGSGPCGIEISLAEKFRTSYSYHCLDLNERLLTLGKNQAVRKGLNLTVQTMDLNRITIEPAQYDIITAFASLHHLIELERVYEAVNRALKPEGIFVVLDVITRNGLRMWPETFSKAKAIWSILPDKYKMNHTLHVDPSFTPELANKNHSTGNFEGVRSGDVLPLISLYFDPVIYIPLHSICRIFLDTTYGPNYDMSNPGDRAAVEFLWSLDRHYLEARILPPGSMFAVMRKKGCAEPEKVQEVSRRMLGDCRSRMRRWVAAGKGV